MRITSFILVLALAACSGQPVDSNSGAVGDRGQALNPGQSVDVAVALAVAGITNVVQSFFVKNTEEKVLVTEKKSRIHIPKNAFRRMDGKQISGDVKITFSEYQTPGEILASGLPMTYTGKDGKTINFESAGMFEIRAYDGKVPLELAPEKEVKVELASPSEGAYNFYQMSDNTREWKEVATNQQAIPNPRFSPDAAAPKVAPAKTPIKRKLTSKPFDLRANPEKYQEFQEMNGVMWQYAGKNPKEDPSNNPSVFNKKYEFQRMVPSPGDSLTFIMSFTSKTDSIRLEMAPVFTPKLKERFMQNRAKKEKERAEMSRRERLAAEQNDKEAELLRVFNLDHLGVCNYDRQLHEPNVIAMNPKFKFGNKDHKDNAEANIFLIPQGKNAVIRYTMETLPMFRIDPAINNQLLAVVGKKIYALSADEIRDLKLHRFRDSDVTITLKPVEQKVTGGKDIDKILASL